MTITRRTFSGGAMALAALTATKSAIAQTSGGTPMLEVKPFQINISDAAISDLKTRLGQTRWPHAITTDWSRGQPLKLIMELTDQWKNIYDWRKHEAELNRYPQFMTEIDGQPIHFMHIKSKVPNALPLILSHGCATPARTFLAP